MFNELRWLRIGLPGVIAAAGVIVGFSGGNIAEAAGFTLVGVAVIVLIVNLLYVMSARDSSNRDAEEEARRQFDRTGHWPPRGG